LVALLLGDKLTVSIVLMMYLVGSTHFAYFTCLGQENSFNRPNATNLQNIKDKHETNGCFVNLLNNKK